MRSRVDGTKKTGRASDGSRTSGSRSAGAGSTSSANSPGNRSVFDKVYAEGNREIARRIRQDKHKETLRKNPPLMENPVPQMLLRRSTVQTSAHKLREENLRYLREFQASCVPALPYPFIPNARSDEPPGQQQRRPEEDVQSQKAELEFRMNLARRQLEWINQRNQFLVHPQGQNWLAAKKFREAQAEHMAAAVQQVMERQQNAGVRGGRRQATAGGSNGVSTSSTKMTANGTTESHTAVGPPIGSYSASSRAANGASTGHADAVNPYSTTPASNQTANDRVPGGHIATRSPYETAPASNQPANRAPSGSASNEVPNANTPTSNETVNHTPTQHTKTNSTLAKPTTQNTLGVSTRATDLTPSHTEEWHPVRTTGGLPSGNLHSLPRAAQTATAAVAANVSAPAPDGGRSDQTGVAATNGGASEGTGMARSGTSGQKGGAKAKEKTVKMPAKKKGKK